MPFSHLTITVSHLPSSTSFFLSCLQPLGYRFIGRSDDYIGFGQKPGEPADFWITEQKQGYPTHSLYFPRCTSSSPVYTDRISTPAGAAHIAFPAQSKEAVSQFFVRALKAGGKFHGEPRTRDAGAGSFSAAVLDFDGNSIEAVYRSSTSGSDSGPAASSEVIVSPRGLLLENGSAASPAKQGYVSSYAPKSPVGNSRVGSVLDRGALAAPGPGQGSGSPTYVVQEQKPDDGKTAKTIVGTLVGAAAGAAIAYAMVKGEGQSDEAAREYPQLVAPQSQPQQALEQKGSRVIEAPPTQSTYSRTNAFNQTDSGPLLTRSVTSKNPRASTVYGGEAAEFYAGGGEPYRRASEGSVHPSSEQPLRAVEYPPEQCPCNPPTLISSFTEKLRRTGGGNGNGNRSKSGSVYSSSTVKPPKSTTSPCVYQSSSSQHDAYQTGKSTTSSTRTARNTPLPQTTTTPTASAVSSKTYRTTRSGVSARNIPLPESVAPSSSRASHHSKPSSHSGSRASRRSTKFDEPVRPSDSVSQVSSNASQQPVRAGGLSVGRG